MYFRMFLTPVTPHYYSVHVVTIHLAEVCCMTRHVVHQMNNIPGYEQDFQAIASSRCSFSIFPKFKGTVKYLIQYFIFDT